MPHEAAADARRSVFSRSATNKQKRGPNGPRVYGVVAMRDQATS
jgi:hypothetical protein